MCATSVRKARSVVALGFALRRECEHDVALFGCVGTCGTGDARAAKPGTPRAGYACRRVSTEQGGMNENASSDLAHRQLLIRASEQEGPIGELGGGRPATQQTRASTELARSRSFREDLRLLLERPHGVSRGCPRRVALVTKASEHTHSDANPSLSRVGRREQVWVRASCFSSSNEVAK